MKIDTTHASVKKKLSILNSIKESGMEKEALGPQAGFVVAGQRDEGQTFDGLVSMRGLHFEEIGFDFENHRISWKK